MTITLQARQAGGGSVQPLPSTAQGTYPADQPADQTASAGWRLTIPAGAGGQYRLAQLDDAHQRPRQQFVYQPPLRMTLRARVSAADLPGTWGFGLWNDPFSASLGLRGAARRMPALPDAVWFFYAGAPNYLALRDTHPAQGLLAATFRARRLPGWLLAPAALAAPLLLLPATARLLRRAARFFIQEDAATLPGDPTLWRDYQLDWHDQQVSLSVDGALILRTPVSPRGPLSLIVWIDNQFAAFPPSGRLQMGASPNPAAFLEVAGLSIT